MLSNNCLKIERAGSRGNESPVTGREQAAQEDCLAGRGSKVSEPARPQVLFLTCGPPQCLGPGDEKAGPGCRHLSPSHAGGAGRGKLALAESTFSGTSGVRSKEPMGGPAWSHLTSVRPSPWVSASLSPQHQARSLGVLQPALRGSHPGS